MSNATIVACPLCNTLNRIPKNKLAANGKCGSCQKPIFNKSPLTLDDHSFVYHVIKSNLPILVDFWAPWCGPCKTMAPILVDAAKELEPNIRIAKINTEAEQLLSTQFNIRSIPTLVILQEGKEINRIAGALPLTQLSKWVLKTLSNM